MTTSLREKAQEMAETLIANFNKYAKRNPVYGEDAKQLIVSITEALEAAYKQGAMARIEGPKVDDILPDRSECTEFMQMQFKIYEDGRLVFTHKLHEWLRDFVSAKVEGK